MKINILLTLPIETLVDLIIAGDEIEQRVFKAIKYIEQPYEYQSQAIVRLEIVKKILKGENNE